MKVGRGVCVCIAQIRFDCDLTLSSPLPFPSPCISAISSVEGDRIRHSFHQNLPSLLLYPSIIIHLLSVCHFSCPCPCHCVCCDVCCCVICSFTLYASRDSWLCTLHNLHLPLLHDPSSNTNFTCILRHFCTPLYVLLDLVGILTNYFVVIIANLISETLHRQNIEGSF